MVADEHNRSKNIVQRKQRVKLQLLLFHRRSYGFNCAHDRRRSNCWVYCLVCVSFQRRSVHDESKCAPVFTPFGEESYSFFLTSSQAIAIPVTTNAAVIGYSNSGIAPDYPSLSQRLDLTVAVEPMTDLLRKLFLWSDFYCQHPHR